MKQCTVLVIDSGIGGLSVAKHIAEHCPEASLVYLADRAQFPYGSKTPTEVIRRMFELVSVATARFDPDLVVIGCNTASTIALSELRNHFKLPFVGVVPAIKPACKISRNKKIGVLATSGTVATQYLKRLIAEFALNCEVISYGSTRLAQIAEQKFQGLPVDAKAVADEVYPLFNQTSGDAIDTVVLACTHFPLLLKELNHLSPTPVEWVDSGSAIARRVAFLLEAEAEEGCTRATALPLFISTDPRHPYDRLCVASYIGDHRLEYLTI